MKKFTPQENIQRTMESLDRLQRIQTPPGLYEKVMAKVNKPTVKVIPLHRRWQVAAAAVLLVINTFSLSFYVKQNSNTGQDNYYEALAEDYSVSLTTETMGY